MERPTTLTPIDNAGVCRHRYAKTADGITTHHVTAKYGTNVCLISKNCGEYGFLPTGELMRPIEEVTLNELF